MRVILFQCFCTFIVKFKTKFVMTSLERTSLSRSSVGTSRSRGSYQSLAISPIADPAVDGIYDGDRKKLARLSSALCLVSTAIVACICWFSIVPLKSPILQAARIVPFSSVDPRNMGFETINRSLTSQPGKIFADLRNENIPLPTNSWCENLFLGDSTKDPACNAFQLPYIVDTSGLYQGIRTHAVRVQSNDRTVMMIFEHANGVILGAMEEFLEQHQVASAEGFSTMRLAVILQWKSANYTVPEFSSSLKSEHGSTMYAPIVRGSPYISMIYENATPRLYNQRGLGADIVIDGGDSTFAPLQAPRLICGEGHGVFSAQPVLVKRELMLTFDVSDMTWLVFVSEPTEFVCSNLAINTAKRNEADEGNAVVPPKLPGWESQEPHFELRATKPMKKGMIRIAMANNCTQGQSAIFCNEVGRPEDQSEFIELLRTHAEVYPTAAADIQFEFPAETMDEEEGELRLAFDWQPAHMSDVANIPTGHFAGSRVAAANDFRPPAELLVYALPHHQERMEETPESSNEVLSIGCLHTLHGIACPVIGSKWSIVEHLHRVSFSAPRPVRQEMLPAIEAALQQDILYDLPLNYRMGAGDTYFCGKMLARLARIIIIADEVGAVTEEQFQAAITRLQDDVDVWINGSASSPLLYDPHWGGLVSCGCSYDGDTQDCRNKYPNCPALDDPGENFGNAFYNDHHYHYGYLIYAAAVVSKFRPGWARESHERVMALVRDIANPSPMDPFFPTWRHKDWYLGFSWANGIIMREGRPNPNGRNQESSSESISAYEAVALYGQVMAQIFGDSEDPLDGQKHDVARAVSAMGRLLYSTEIRSARTYWHVQAPEAGVTRIYPAAYLPRVVGMVWSMMAQEQTWFGNEPYKSYGIQLLPLTPASEQRDTPSWVTEMLPFFNKSCAENPACAGDGWSILVHAAMATAGQWFEAWQLLDQLPAEVYEGAGGNGHSRSNSLWYIATRPSPNDSQNHSTPSAIPSSNPTVDPWTYPWTDPTAEPSAGVPTAAPTESGQVPLPPVRGLSTAPTVPTTPNPPIEYPAPPGLFSCFAASETLTLESGEILPISRAKVGQRVLAASMAGDDVSIAYSAIVAIPHPSNNILAQFVHLQTEPSEPAVEADVGGRNKFCQNDYDESLLPQHERANEEERERLLRPEQEEEGTQQHDRVDRCGMTTCVLETLSCCHGCKQSCKLNCTCTHLASEASSGGCFKAAGHAIAGRSDPHSAPTLVSTLAPALASTFASTFASTLASASASTPAASAPTALARPSAPASAGPAHFQSPLQRSSIKLTPDHLILAGSCEAASQVKFKLIPASQVKVGSCLMAVKGRARVVAREIVWQRGVFTVVTGQALVVVNGIIASPFAGNHAVAHAYYNILRGMNRIFPAVISRLPWLRSGNLIFGNMIQQCSAVLTGVMASL